MGGGEGAVVLQRSSWHTNRNMKQNRLKRSLSYSLSKAINLLIVYSSHFPASSTFSFMRFGDLLWKWERCNIKQTVLLAVQTRQK